MSPKIRPPRKFPNKRRDINVDEAIVSSTASFLTDIECIVEMFHAVDPVLKEVDDSRQQNINSFKKTLEEARNKKGSKEEFPLYYEMNSVVKNINKLHKARLMFRRDCLVMMVSRYDQFIAGVLRGIFLATPDRLKSQEKTLTYDEILQLGSLKKAIDKFIDKEIDTLLRDSHIEQIKSIEKQLKIVIRERLTLLSQLTEIIERRNIFVHAGGIVNQQYLSTCKSNGVILDKGIKEGDRLSVNDKYLRNAYKCLLEVGLVINQLVLKKLWPKKLETADNFLNGIGYEFLVAEDWEFSNLVFDFALSCPKSQIASDERLKIYTINKCIALKWSGDTDRMEKLLNDTDWSSCDPKFVLAVHVLRNENKEAESLMASLSPRGSIKEEDFRNWPVFRDFRNTKNFIRAFKLIYHKEYFPKLQIHEEIVFEQKVNEN